MKLILKKITIISGLIIIMLFSQCSRTKDTFTRRFYHSLTARYNSYFNGNESLKEGIETIEKNHKDDFNSIISVFKYGSENDAKSVYPQMDRAIAKAAKSIQRHSMFIKGKERNPWIDECYLLMGKANFYKREYYTANEIFYYIVNSFDNSSLTYDTYLWLARSYNQMNKYTSTFAIFSNLEELKNKPYVKKHQKALYEAIKAEYYIKTKSYEEAIPALTKAISLTKDKKQKARYSFILAQVYETLGDLKSASTSYAKVIKYNPPYELEFNAKIKRAALYNIKNQDEKQEIKKQLIKMLRDVKNKEYLDQIYYSLAEIEVKENNIKKAIEYYTLSIQTSVSNNSQKGLSALKLANIYFDNSEYEKSQIYYDTAVAFLPKDYPNYQAIEKKKNNLTNLVKNLKTIQLEDSLQKLAKLSPQQQETIINQIIQKIIDEENKKKEEEQKMQQLYNNMTGGMTASNNPLLNDPSTSSKWYFYNPAALKFGYAEFAKKWGNRKLEDHWRRSNKEIVVDFSSDLTNTSTSKDSIDSIANNVVNLKDKNYYLKQIPKTEKDIEASNDRIINAYYNLGFIYKENLGDVKKSIEAFETLLKRFPGNKYELMVLYYLYRISLEINDKNREAYYKNKIITEHPETDYAQLILEPEKFLNSEANKSKVEILYKNTWTAFENKNYAQVFKNVRIADSLYPESRLIPKFHYLSTLAIGKTQEKNNFIASLNNIITKYPQHDVAIHAKNILEYLGVFSKDTTSKTTSNNNQNNSTTNNRNTKNEITYKLNDNAIHLYVLVVSIMDADINKLKASIADFNSQYYSLEKLQINSLYLESKVQLITVSNFKGKAKAMDYYTNISQNSNFLTQHIKGSYNHFVISTENYTTFYKSKDVNKYLQFFYENYTK